MPDLSRIRSLARRSRSSPKSVVKSPSTVVDLPFDFAAVKVQGKENSPDTAEHTLLVAVDDDDERQIEAVDVSNDEDDNRPLSEEALTYLSKVASSQNEVDRILGSSRLETSDGVLIFENLGDDENAADGRSGRGIENLFTTTPQATVTFQKAENL